MRVITIRILFGLTRFRKEYSVCMLHIWVYWRIFRVFQISIGLFIPVTNYLSVCGDDFQNRIMFQNNFTDIWLIVTLNCVPWMPRLGVKITSNRETKIFIYVNEGERVDASNKAFRHVETLFVQGRNLCHAGLLLVGEK